MLDVPSTVSFDTTNVKDLIDWRTDSTFWSSLVIFVFIKNNVCADVSVLSTWESSLHPSIHPSPHLTSDPLLLHVVHRSDVEGSLDTNSCHPVNINYVQSRCASGSVTALTINTINDIAKSKAPRCDVSVCRLVFYRLLKCGQTKKAILYSQRSSDQQQHQNVKDILKATESFMI